jgi:ABC-type amino acid transport substrate-binding protein
MLWSQRQQDFHNNLIAKEILGSRFRNGLMQYDGWKEWLGQQLSAIADALGIEKLFAAFVDLAQQNVLLAFLTLLLVTYYVMFRLILPLYQLGRTAEPAPAHGRRGAALHLTVALLFGAVVSAIIVRLVTEADIPRLTLPTPNIELGVDNLLQWPRPKGFEHKIVEYEVQSSPDATFRTFQSEVTGDNVLPLFAQDNRARYWRIRMLVFDSRGSGPSKGRWSNVVRIEQYQNALSRIQQTGELRVAMSNTYGRSWFRFYLRDRDPSDCRKSETRNTGFDILLAREIGDRLERHIGRKVAVAIMPMPWSEVMPSVGKGNTDVAISTITIKRDREREHGIVFSAPYYRTGQAVVFRSSADAFRKTGGGATGLRSLLAGRRVGVHGTTSSHGCLQALQQAMADQPGSPGFKMELYNSEVVALHEVARAGARIDFAVTDQTFAEGWKALLDSAQRTHNKVEFALFQREDFLLRDGSLAPDADPSCWTQDYGIAARAGEDKLLSAVNEILAELGRDGLQKIERQARAEFGRYVASYETSAVVSKQDDAHSCKTSKGEG